MTREEALARLGWTRQSTHDEPRLSELVEMYREIGMTVHLQPFDPIAEAGCAECMKSDPGRYQTIYTKKKPDNGQ